MPVQIFREKITSLFHSMHKNNYCSSIYVYVYIQYMYIHTVYNMYMYNIFLSICTICFPQQDFRKAYLSLYFFKKSSK